MFPSTNLKREMFSCKCGCGGNVVDAELLSVLDAIIFAHYKIIPTIHSAYRCTYHNRISGGKLTSKHISGLAVDFHIPGVDHADIYHFLDSLFDDKYGIGLYSWGIHLDVRAERARW